MFTQSDERWKSFEMATGITIGVYGCLVTALCNILVELGFDYNPMTLTQKLKDKNGFDNQGCLNNVVFDLFGLKENKYLPTDSINWSNSDKTWYIIVIPISILSGTHFCNILSVSNNVVYYFDTYDGRNKQVQLERVISIREIIKI